MIVGLQKAKLNATRLILSGAYRVTIILNVHLTKGVIMLRITSKKITLPLCLYVISMLFIPSIVLAEPETGSIAARQAADQKAALAKKAADRQAKKTAETQLPAQEQKAGETQIRADEKKKNNP